MLPATFFRLITLSEELLKSTRVPTLGIVITLAAAALLSACSGGSTISSAPDTKEPGKYLAVIDGEPLYVDELLSQFNRSASLASDASEDSLAEYRDFLDRYVGFRLKVLEARSAGYADLPEMKQEILQYRNQLARPYLLESEVTAPLIRELYERRQTMISASHILLRAGIDSSPEDTLAAFNKMALIMDSVSAGVDFGDLAFRNSEDPSASGAPDRPGYRGHLGFFGGGNMVYEFENAAYETEPGQISSAFRTQFGYHVIYVHERRPFPPDLRVAHIMIRPEGNKPADSLAAYTKLESIQNSIDSGEDFGVLAASFSVDTYTSRNGGELQRISYDSGLPGPMRDAAYELETGEVSDIVESPFGYHLIKVLEVYPVKTIEESTDEFQVKLAKLPRSAKAEKAWKVRVRDDAGFRIDSTFLSQWSGKFYAPGNSTESEIADSVLAQPVIWLGEAIYLMSDYLDYIGTLSPKINRADANDVLGAANEFVLEKGVENEIDRLEKNDDEFARTMREFQAGLLLFRLMEDSVWTAAGTDSVGLLAYYETNSGDYHFEDRTRVISFTTKDNSVANKIVSEIRSLGYAEPVVTAVTSDSTSSVRIDTTLVEAVTNSVYDRVQEIPWDAITDPIDYNSGYIILYNDGPDPARQRTFEEARALVVNGYQDVLEERLLDRLRIKYSTTVYPENLQSVFSQVR